MTITEFLLEADSHWACMTCSAGTNKPVTARRAEIAAANHASQGGHPTVWATSERVQ